MDRWADHVLDSGTQNAYHTAYGFPPGTPVAVVLVHVELPYEHRLVEVPLAIARPRPQQRLSGRHVPAQPHPQG